MPELLYFLASVGNLFLASLVVSRARRARGSLPIALLCMALFLWDVSEAAKLTLENEYWAYLRLVGTSLAPAFLWHFVIVFTHRERTLRWWRNGLYAVTACFTLLTAGALFSKDLQSIVDGKEWNLAYLLLLFPFLLASFWLVRARLREVEAPVERNALHFVSVGIAVGTVTGLTNLIQVFWTGMPPLGHLGSVMCTLLLAVAILRHRMLEQATPVRRVLFVSLLVLSLTVVLTVLYRETGDWNVALAFGAAGAVTLAALWRFLFARWYEQSRQRQRLAIIGGMAAAVAHEIKNPLASIKGAAQLVQKELEDAGTKPRTAEYLRLLAGEVDRLDAVVESFLEYARPMEPRLQELPIEPFLRDLLHLHEPSMPPSIRIETRFDAGLAEVPADPALLTHAVTNVLRNAVEAVTEEGTLTVRTRRVVTALRNYAAIEIADTGPGIPRDLLAQVFQPFFTTKSRGTGLGLAIAQRIMEAHGGDIALENLAVGGCRITLLLPLKNL